MTAMKPVPTLLLTTTFAVFLALTAPHPAAQAAGGVASASPRAVSGAAVAGQAKVPAFVEKVEFSAMRGASKHPMMRMDVSVKALANAKRLEDPSAVVPNPDWVDKIKVTATIAFENKRAGKVAAAASDKSFIFYRASATVLTMKRNEVGTVAFYLPGELLARDNIIRPQPLAYAVDIEVDGVKAAPSQHSYSKVGDFNLAIPGQMEAFRMRAEAAVGETAGMLLNQLQVSAFIPPPKASLTLVREDTTR